MRAAAVVGARFSASQRERSEQESEPPVIGQHNAAASRRVRGSIDSVFLASYTQGSILQARAAGKAVRIGRGPATVIG